MKKELLITLNNKYSWIILIVIYLSFPAQSQTYFGQQNLISNGDQKNPDVLFAEDINGDGNIDVIIASPYEYKLVWYENTDGLGNFGDQKIITSKAGNVTSVFATDLDGDGDVDILTATGCHNEIMWYENTNGLGAFSEKQLITSDLNFAFCVYAADIDSDGDMDVISASRDDGKIAWYQNDGNGNFGTQLIVSTAIAGARTVFAKDLDGDGDIDLLSGGYWSNIVAWHKNIDGHGHFSEAIIISNMVSAVMSVFAADLDGDADMDVLSASYNDNKIAWYENTNGIGNFGNQKIISSSCNGAADIFSIDLDKDGDMDILSGSIISDKVIWHENMDGNGNFDSEHIISSLMHGPMSIYAIDVNGDTNIDILSVFNEDDKVAWFENFTLKILSQPHSQDVCPNTNTFFEVLAEDAIDYQWQVNEGNGYNNLIDNNIYSGANTETLFITAANLAMSGSQYRCIISNPGGSINSTSATLIVKDNELPIISSNHDNKSINANNNCMAVLPDYTIEVIATDNCDTNLDIIQYPNVGTSISGFTNTVTIEITDDANNSISVSFNVEVLDSMSPTLVCAKNKNIKLHKGQTSYIVDGTEFNPVLLEDNCGIESITNSYNSLETLKGAKLQIGTTTVNWTAIDKSNNIVKCSHDITIKPNNEIIIYPNPTNGIAYVYSDSGIIQKIIIYNINGKTILIKKATHSKESINLNALPSGIYIVKTITTSGIFIKKIVKEKI